MLDTKPNFYTIDQIYENVYNRQLSKTTIHKLCRAGTIPSQRIVRKFLVPAWWVEQQLQLAQVQAPRA